MKKYSFQRVHETETDLKSSKVWIKAFKADFQSLSEKKQIAIAQKHVGSSLGKIVEIQLLKQDLTVHGTETDPKSSKV